MSKYTVIGDVHAKLDNLDKVRTLFDIIEDLGNPVIFLGDLLDNKAIIRAECLNLYYRLIKRSKLHFTLLVGNHDFTNLECKDHSLQTLKELINVHVIDELYSSGEGQAHLAFIPYSNLETFRHNLKLCKKAGVSTIFCHADTVGFDHGNGHISESGADLGGYKSFKKIISGHYHKFQEEGNLLYLGSPFSHSFGESNQAKYIGIFDSETEGLELLESPFPKHCTTIVNCDKNSNCKLDENDINRVILTGKEENIAKVPKLEGVKYIERPVQAVTETVVDESQSSEVQFVRWAEEIAKLEKSIIKLGLEVLEDV